MKSKQMKKIKMQQKIIITNCIVISILMVLVLGLAKNHKNLKDEIISLNDEISSLTTEIADNETVMMDMKDTIIELDTQLQNVSNVNKSYVDELTELRSRSELYNKYSYAIINDSGQRTHLTYEEIKLGEQLMIEKGYDPDLMFGTIMVESGGNPNAVNTSSGATGYGQFLNSTAEYVWTRLLNNNNYHSEIRKDGKSNIQMMAEYYDHLYSQGKSTFGVIKHYSGNSTDEGAARYLARINRFTQKVGAVVN